MDKERVFKRVKKLLALAGNNPNEEEANSAMAKAQALMAEYSVEASELSFDSTEEKMRSLNPIEMAVTYADRINWWQKSLASVIADNFRCFHFYRGRSGSSRIFFFGAENDVHIAKEVYTFAETCLKHLSTQYIKNREKREWFGFDKTAVKNDYIRAFIQGVRDNLKEQVQREGWGLVLVKDALVVQTYEDLSKDFGKSRSSHVKRNYDSHARETGYRDGKNIDSQRKALT